MATAVPRTASSGSPTATTTATPDYSGTSSPIRASGAGTYTGTTAIRRSVLEPGQRTLPEGATFTGTVAIPVTQAAEQLAVRAGLPADAAASIVEYRRTVGTFPDLAQLDALGEDVTTTQLDLLGLGALGGGLNLWIILSVVGLGLFLIFGRDGSGGRGRRR